MLAIGLVQLLLLLGAALDLGTALAIALRLPAEPTASLGRAAVGLLVALASARLVVAAGLARRAPWSRAGALVVVLAGAADLPHGPLVALVTLAVLAGRAGGAWYRAAARRAPRGLRAAVQRLRPAAAPPAPPRPPRPPRARGRGPRPGRRGPPGSGRACCRRHPRTTRSARGPTRSSTCAACAGPPGSSERLTGRAPGTAGLVLDGPEPARAPDGTPLGADGKPTLAKPARAVPDLPGYYRYTDDQGTAHLTQDFDSIPERYRY